MLVSLHIQLLYATVRYARLPPRYNIERVTLSSGNIGSSGRIVIWEFPLFLSKTVIMADAFDLEALVHVEQESVLIKCSTAGVITELSSAFTTPASRMVSIMVGYMASSRDARWAVKRASRCGKS